MEALLPRFRAAHTQVLGVSVDSVYCHANWGRDLGGVSFPLLSDFQPKGGMAGSYGLYLEDSGITDRATVIIDRGGTVRQAVSVTPSGQRDPEALAAACEEIDREFGQGLADISAPAGLPSGTRLFVKSQCGFSRAVLLARDNLHLGPVLPAANASEDATARRDLAEAAGKDQAPCLIHDGETLHEAAAIIRFLVQAASDLPA